MLSTGKKILLGVFGVFYPFLRKLVSKIPRDPELIVFFRHSTFSDNVKYQFLYSYNRLNARVVFLTISSPLAKLLQKQGFEAFTLYSKEGLRTALQAGIFVADDGLPHHAWFKWGAQLVELWHGGPMKKCGYADEFDVFYNPRNLYWKILHELVFKHDFSAMDWFITTSRYFGEIFRRSMKLKNVLNLGAPRTDVFFKKIPGWELNVDLSVFERIERARENGSNIVLYAPTFRRRSSLDETALLRNASFIHWLRDRNILLLVKLHWLSLRKAGVMLSKPLSKAAENILVLRPESDVYPILPYTDLLLTDYSSIFYDYLLLDKPIIFYAADLQEYLQKERKFYFDYPSFVPGRVVFTVEDLRDALVKELEEPESYKEKRKKVKELAFDLPPGKATVRIHSFLKRLLENIS